jgi:PadR family transcriptional regulator, regulatory protein PadR
MTGVPVGRMMTELLKGTLEGIVLSVLIARPAHGYDITLRLRADGFAEIAEGTIYALLLRLEGRGFARATLMPSDKGPPRKVFALTDQGRAHLAEFRAAWAFLAERLKALESRGEDDDV